MNEAETRAEHIDPALKAAGWGVVEGSKVLRERKDGSLIEIDAYDLFRERSPAMAQPPAFASLQRARAAASASGSSPSNNSTMR